MALLAMTALVTALAVAAALAVRVRDLAAIGWRPTTSRWLLAGVGVGFAARVVAVIVVLAYVGLTGDVSNPQDYLAGAATRGPLDLLGVANALLYERSGSVWPAVAAHVVNNALAFGAAASVLTA